MKKVTVKSVHLVDDKITDGPILMEAALDGGKLQVVGNVPSRFSDAVVGGLTGEAAEDMFYILAASPQSTYSITTFEGTDVEDIKNYLGANFSQEELVSINPYLGA